MKEIKGNQENTPPVSPYNDDPNSDDELVYVGDDIDEVIQQLGEDEDGMNFSKSFLNILIKCYCR